MSNSNLRNYSTNKQNISFENIIAQIMEEFLTNLLDEYKKFITSHNMIFSDLVRDIKDYTDLLGRRVVKLFMEEMDNIIREDNTRKEFYYIERRDKKSILTLLGTLEYERTYYRLKDLKSRTMNKVVKKLEDSTYPILPRYTYLLDDILDIQRHKRIDDDVKIRLVENAIDMSYQKSADTLFPKTLTRQTVLNSIRGMKHIIENLDRYTNMKGYKGHKGYKGYDRDTKTEGKKDVRVLYIEADEDHVALQSGKKVMAKLVYIHEGKDKKDMPFYLTYPNHNQTNLTEDTERIEKTKEIKEIEKAGSIKKTRKTREKLKNAYYKVYIDKDTDTLWEDVLDYVYQRYRYENIEKIYIAGDGAKWIREGLGWILKSRFVLDKYHLNKYLTPIWVKYPKYTQRLWEIIDSKGEDPDDSKDIGKINLLFEELLNKIETKHKSSKEKKKEKKMVQDAKRYIVNNWDGIKIYPKDPDVIGPSAEGHVSHILSHRLSSRPLGWSKEGLKLMAKLRVFKSNNGNLREIVKRINDERREERRKSQGIYTFWPNKEEVKPLIRDIPKRGIVEKVTKKHSFPYEGLNNIPILNRGKIEPMYNILKSIKYGGRIV